MSYHITVTGNIGKFQQGQVLTVAADVADYYRTVMSEDATKPCVLPESVILDVVNSIEGDTEDAEFERLEALESRMRSNANPDDDDAEGTTPEAEETETEEAEAEPVPDAVDLGKVQAGNAFTIRARQIADRLNEDAEVLNILDANAEAKRTVARGPVDMMLELQVLLGDDIATLPEPGSVEFDEETKQRNPNPDKYKYEVTVNGEIKKKSTSFYRELSFATVRGRDLAQEVDWLSDTQGPSVPNWVKSLDDYQRGALLKRRRVALSGIANLLRAAIRLDRQIRAIKSMPGVEFSYIYTDAEETDIVDHQTCMVVWELNKDGKRARAKSFTSTGLLALDVPAALAAGGGWSKLMETATKGTPDDDGTPKMTSAIPDKNIGKFQEYIYETLAWLKNGRDNQVPLMVALRKTDAESSKFIVALSDLSNLIDAAIEASATAKAAIADHKKAVQQAAKDKAA